MQYAYNGFGLLTIEYQAPSGAVNTGTSPKAQYAYTDASGTINHARRHLPGQHGNRLRVWQWRKLR